MPLDPNNARAVVREVLVVFCQNEAPDWAADLDAHADWLAGRLAPNLVNQRPQKLAGLPRTSVLDASRLRDYVHVMVRCYHAHLGQIQQLARRDSNAWQALYDDLKAVAYLRYLTVGMSSERAQQEAEDVASAACGRIYESQYPCDTPFTAWARRIVINVIHGRGRSTDIYDRSPGKLVSLDAAPRDGIDMPLHEEIVDPGAETPFEDLEQTDALLRSISTLASPAERTVMMSTLDGMDDKDIAALLGKTVGNVQTIRSRAQTRLRELRNG
ncbi:MAG: sigma-70 family RNA polymerase sigma factor [Chloroflexi bacterium]|nr:sigma-70 family RNA polymerase sigma factor [Chloroflexota bacterium]